MMVLASKKIHVSEYSPAQIKLTIAGSGKASKKEVLDAVMYSLELKKPPKPDDSADALAIALTKLNEDGINWQFDMKIFENKKLERDTFRKLRDGISLNQRENVEKNVRLYVDSFVKEHKNIGYIAIYLSLIHISEPTRPLYISYAVFCLKKKNWRGIPLENLEMRYLWIKVKM